MTSINTNVQMEKRKFHLYEHPWLSLLVFIITTVFSIALSGTVIFGLMKLPEDSPIVQFTQGMSYHILTIFILVPFVLRLPKEKRTYRQYLDDIGLSRMQPFIKLMLLALSCYVILALSQIAASLVYRLSEGLPITLDFIRRVINFSGDLPPGSSSLLISIPSAFEEAAFRGIVLTVFLNKYSVHKSIVFSSLGFGLMLYLIWRTVPILYG
jgi:membrane protease YdiL (CAAX protease family)